MRTWNKADFHNFSLSYKLKLGYCKILKVLKEWQIIKKPKKKKTNHQANTTVSPNSTVLFQILYEILIFFNTFIVPFPPIAVNFN